MATPQSKEAAAAAIDRMASNRLGAEPTHPSNQAAAQQGAQQAGGQQAGQQQQAAAVAAQAQQQAQQRPEPSPSQNKEESQEGKAQEKASPETEGDKSQKEAYVYEIDFGDGQKRKLTPEQIASTFQRYSALNYENAQLKPVNSVIKQIMQQTGARPEDVAAEITNAFRARQHNPQMGNVDQDKSGEPKKDGPGSQQDGDPLAKWEEDNAASLPPGYREMMDGQRQTQQMMNQLQQMMAQVLGQAQGTAQAAQGQAQGARQTKADAVRQQIANNIDRAQQQLRLPDDAAEDFMTFAGERGFTLEDFVDPTLAVRVMQDFANNRNSPEMERLRAMAQRRQAFTGALGQMPGDAGGGAATAPATPQDGGDQRLNGMVDKIMAQRNQ